MTDIKSRLTDAIAAELEIRRGTVQTWGAHIADRVLSLPGLYTGQDVANAYQQGARDTIKEANRRAGRDLWLTT
jgi:hypothetical protein